MPAHSNTVAVTAANANSTTISSFVVSGTDVGLFVKVSLRGTGLAVTGVTWNGTEDFTEAGNDINGNAEAGLWFLANPTKTTADIVVSLDGLSRHVSAVSLYTDVDQTNPIRLASVAVNNGTNNAPTVDVVANADEVVIDVLCQVSNGPDTATADHTQRHNTAATGGGSDTRGASQEKASTGATETMGWSMSDADNWAVVAGALQEPQSQTFFQTNTGSMTPSGALERQIGKSVDGSLTPAGALTKLIQVVLDGGSMTATGDVATQTVVMQAVDGSMTPSGILTRQINKIVAGSTTPTGTVQKQINKILVGTLTPSGALQKRIGKVLDGSLTPTGTVATTVVIMLQLTGQMIVAGALSTLVIFPSVFKRFRDLISPVITPVLRRILRED